MRVGVVAFTNAIPLSHGLEDFLPNAELIRLTPSRIAEQLANGSLDLGLVPVAALASHPEWSVIPGLGIASEGPVRSVLLFSKVVPERIGRLVLDPASLTSNVLARLWLTHCMGKDPVVIPGAALLVNRLEIGDATVAIGDEALFWPKDETWSLDLGGAWTDWTGLPFVFAVWGGPGARAPELAPALLACHERNMTQLGRLAMLYADGDPVRAGLLEGYWKHSIRYRLGKGENEGLMQYLGLGAEAGFLPPVREGRVHVQVV